MEIREIDGKQFIKFDEYKAIRFRRNLSILFLFLLIIAIIVLINAISVLLKNKDIIQQDPLIYGMKVHNFSSCQCFDFEGKDWYSTETGFIHKEYGKGWINYSELILNITALEKRVINGTIRNT